MRALLTAALLLAGCAEPVIPLVDAGTPVPNRCAPTPDDVDFGVVSLVSDARTIHVRNPTQETLIVEVGDAPPPFTLESGRFKLTAGQQALLDVSVQPMDSLTHFARVTFSGGLGCQPTSFVLSAVAVGQVTVSPTQLDFGAVGLGEAKTLAVVLTNSTDHDVSFTQAATNNPVFTVASRVVELAPRQSTVVQVEARPVVFGTTAGGLVLAGPGFSRAVVMQVHGGRAIAQLDPEAVDVPLVPFFAEAPAASFVARAVTLRNLGPPLIPPSGALRITGPVRVEALDGGLDELCIGRWTSGGCAGLTQGTIAGGQALEVPVRIAPTSEGPRQWRVTIPTSDVDQRLLITTTAARPDDCQLDVTPRTLLLGTHPVAEAGAATLTFHNGGATPCFIDSLALVSGAPSGDVDGGFAPVSPATVELDGGASALVVGPGRDHLATVTVVGRFPSSTIAGQVTFHVLRADSGVETVPFMMRVE